jgi:general secretion pathway protein D
MRETGGIHRWRSRSPTAARRPPASWRRLAARLLALLFLLGGAAYAQEEESLTLNFKEADIEALIATVSKLTGKNFVVDPRVKGKVTVMSAAPTDPDALYDVFMSVLNVHGFSAVPSGDIIKIVPDATARFAGATPLGEGTGLPSDEIVSMVIPLENVQATELVPVLRPLLAQEAHLAAHQGANVLVVSATASNVQRLVKVVRRIDQESHQDIEVIRLENADAGELIGVLTALGQSAGAAGAAMPTVAADERTNSILLSGDERQKLEYRALISHLDTPIADAGDIRVVYLRFASAADLVPVLQALGGAAPAATGAQGQQARRPNAALGGDPFQIQADERNNALIIQAPAQRMNALLSVISQLDVRRAQVLVEGIIAEVSSNRADELGVQWKTSVPEDGTFAGTRFPGIESGAIEDPFENSDLPSFMSGLTLGYFSGGDLRGLIRALAGDQFTNVLSTPTLVTMDNAEAEIVVGQNVPFITGQFTSAATTPDNPFQTIERQDIGIVLRVRPQINEGNTVTLEIEQEISNIDRDTSGADLITNKRAVTTTVLVDDGEIIVLGGLIQDDLKENTQKVPLLGDLPLLGTLFRNTRSDFVKTNLMIFLRPKIVRNKETAAELTVERYRDMRARQVEQVKHYKSLLRREAEPVLPTIDGLLE